MTPLRGIAILVLVLAVARPAGAIDYVTLSRDGKTLHLRGKVLVTARDGGLLLQSADGSRWLVEPKEIVKRITDDKPMEPLSAEAAAEAVLRKLPRGFRAHHTAHYVICYNTSTTYARWCGGLLERLYRSFNNYWSRKDFELHEPKFPLVVIICADRASYKSVAAEEIGDHAGEIVGYYNLLTNRVMMQDLTGLEALRSLRGERVTMSHISAMLSHPKAQQMVATVVHEATHQIVYNCGMNERFADIPFWVSEGMAIYFETPDLRSSKGWSTIGKVNRSRLIQFRTYLKTRPRESLLTLISQDKRFRDPKQVLSTYAEAWALTYFLMRTKQKQYEEYLKVLAEKKALIWATPEERIKQFKDAFGPDLAKLDREFLSYMRRVR